MTSIIKTILCSLLAFFMLQARGQGYNSGFTCSMKGYIVNLAGKIFFQPCEDSTIDVWRSLDNRSFSLWYFREDLYLDAVENIGDSSTIEFYESGDKRKYIGTVRSFYTLLEVDMMFLDSTRFEMFKEPKIKILLANRELPLEAFRVDNRVKEIIPKDFKYLKMFYNYYFQKGYIVPQWLDDCYKEMEFKNEHHGKTANK